MNRLVLSEYGQPVLWQAGRNQVKRLREENERLKFALGLPTLPLQIEYESTKRISLRARGIAGFLNFGDFSLEVVPKFLESNTRGDWKYALWNILTLLEDGRAVLGDALAGVTHEDTIADLMGRVLLSSIERSQHETFPRGYQEETGNLHVLRGRLDWSKPTQILTHPHMLPCIYEEYSENTPATRLIRWAAEILAASVRSLTLSSALTEWSSRLKHVDPLPPGLLESERITLPVYMQTLQPAIDVGKLLLKQHYIRHDPEELMATGFVWNSAQIFEQFVAKLLLSYARSHGWRIAAGSQTLAPGDGGLAPLTTFPDFRLYHDSTIIGLFDAKYKILRSRPKISDVYQVMAAGRLNSCQHAFLVYPQSTQTNDLPRTWRIRGPGEPSFVTALFLDLMVMNTAQGFEELQRKLAKQLRPLLEDIRSPSSPSRSRHASAIATQRSSNH